MSILISLEKKYLDAISRGDKRYEFRKKIPRRRICRIYLYVKRPLGQVVGAIRPGEIIRDSPDRLWMRFGIFSGMSEREFKNYFGKLDHGYAIEIRDFVLFREPFDPFNIKGFIPPQQFRYAEDLDFYLKGKLRW